MLNFTAAQAVTNMHKTIILDRYYSSKCEQYLGFCQTSLGERMFICERACEFLAKRKSPCHEYVATFSDEYSFGYRRVRMSKKVFARVGSTSFDLSLTQRDWIRSLGLKTLKGLTGHFYIKVTPFE